MPHPSSMAFPPLAKYLGGIIHCCSDFVYQGACVGEGGCLSSSLIDTGFPEKVQGWELSHSTFCLLRDFAFISNHAFLFESPDLLVLDLLL